MDCFEGKDVDSHALLGRMEAAMCEFEDAFLSLPKPLRAWFNDQYALNGIGTGLMAIHLSTATEAMAELIGADEPEV